MRQKEEGKAKGVFRWNSPSTSPRAEPLRSHEPPEGSNFSNFGTLGSNFGTHARRGCRTSIQTAENAGIRPDPPVPSPRFLSQKPMFGTCIIFFSLSNQPSWSQQELFSQYPPSPARAWPRGHR